MSLLTDFDEERVLAVITCSCLALGNVALALETLKAGHLREFAVDQVIIEQDATDRALFLILHGQVDVRVNRTKRVKARGPKDVIGEMALLQPHEPRSATCLAETAVLVLQIEVEAFRRLAEQHPVLWRNLAAGLSDKVREYTRRVRLSNVVPKVFIGSSSEALDVARALKRGLASPEVEVKVWADAFLPGKYTLEVLQQAAEDADFAVLVLAADDVIEMRKQRRSITRDNVLFELGLFLNALGRERTFALSEQVPDLRILSDIEGVTRLVYDRERPPPATWIWGLRRFCGNLWLAPSPSPSPDRFVEEAAQSIRAAIERLGSR